MEYTGGAAVRKMIVGPRGLQVVTTNESPPSEPIPFHHELAQTPDPPEHICFYCAENSCEGGATPIARSDWAYEMLAREFPDFLAKLNGGVRYVKVAPSEDDPGSALGRSWRSMFGVESKEEAEAAMRKQGYEWEWLENQDLRVTSPPLEATRAASNGNTAFFNQIIAAATGWVDKRNDPTKAVVFAADGSPLPRDVVGAVDAWLRSNQFAREWRPGDFMIVDNTVACHARQPFDNEGVRRIYASISRGPKSVLPGGGGGGGTHLALSSGDLLPSVGLGCWKLRDAEEVVYEAIKAGCRLIDSACDYGNEQETGRGIKRAIEEGLCRREDLFVVSKLWNSFHARVEEGLSKTLEDLQLEYLDLYLIHFPIAQKYVPVSTRYPPEWVYDPAAKFPRMELARGVTYEQTWRGMERLHARGLAKNIGCCNINTAHLHQVLQYAKVKPAVLQVEMHPRNAQSRLLRFARERGVQVMAFSNLGSASYVELDMATPEDSLLSHPVVLAIAKSRDKTPAQILLRWGVQRGTAVIPKSSKPHRLRENLALFDFELSSDQVDQIDALNQNKRYNDPGHFCDLAFNTFCPIYD
ncbi:hypothetical protein CTAYLR_010030 [Chrysophaeum taylorii]|uniref:Uncharacterized protein n=1 Tax=Chrysophaeum taylorii TaxID=2483200 RepID=A0AAD7XL04_9STRA|nr:hypothetical protein CTAYLR_010030 [Chrysophaeum taylorii]